MLHLSTKGSRKSYVTKAACLTAGLIAVLASSSVLAGPARLRCTISPAQDVALGAGDGYKVQVIAPGVFRITFASTGELVRASMLTQCSHNNQTVHPWSSGDNIYFTVSDGARIQDTFGFEATY